MTRAIDTNSPSYAATLAAKYVELQGLRKRIDTELTAVENGLRVAGLMPAGRPTKPPTHTLTEARAAHARWGRGLRDDDTVAGERQYQRERKRAARRRTAA